jgi:hypothetical protein
MSRAALDASPPIAQAGRIGAPAMDENGVFIAETPLGAGGMVPTFDNRRLALALQQSDADYYGRRTAQPWWLTAAVGR